MTDIQSQTKYRCIFYIPGSFFSETVSIEANGPNFVPTQDEWVKRAYAYYITERKTITNDSGDVFKTDPVQIGPIYYKGTLYNIDQVKEGLDNGDMKFTPTLLRNMKNNDDYYDHVLECGQGMIPFDSRQPDKYQLIKE